MVQGDWFVGYTMGENCRLVQIFVVWGNELAGCEVWYTCRVLEVENTAEAGEWKKLLAAGGLKIEGCGRVKKLQGIWVKKLWGAEGWKITECRRVKNYGAEGSLSCRTCKRKDSKIGINLDYSGISFFFFNIF